MNNNPKAMATAVETIPGIIKEWLSIYLPIRMIRWFLNTVKVDG